MVLTNNKPFYDFSAAFPCHHGQQGFLEVVANGIVAGNLVAKANQSQVVDILHAVLLHVDAVL